MAVRQLNEKGITGLSVFLTHYIANQREKYSPRATRLSRLQKIAMQGFYSPQILDQARLLVLKGERIENPKFYAALWHMGFRNLPDQSMMAAITFCDVVVSHDAFSDGLLFHELVHVEQYRQLGIRRFAELYVRGFLTGGGYDAIPLEICAYAVGERYQRDPACRFSVADEVQRWITERRF
jgi:hypothetical protein